jgi:hypothetical protein
MIMESAAFLVKTKAPTEAAIKDALANNGLGDNLLRQSRYRHGAENGAHADRS